MLTEELVDPDKMLLTKKQQNKLNYSNNNNKDVGSQKLVGMKTASNTVCYYVCVYMHIYAYIVYIHCVCMCVLYTVSCIGWSLVYHSFIHMIVALYSTHTCIYKSYCCYIFTTIISFSSFSPYFRPIFPLILG